MGCWEYLLEFLDILGLVYAHLETYHARNERDNYQILPQGLLLKIYLSLIIDLPPFSKYKVVSALGF